MEANILKLYPQYNQNTDRRQQEQPVELERRSGMDRRQESRACVDSKLSQDVSKFKQTYSAFINKKNDLASQIERYNETSKQKNDSKKDVAIGALGTIPYIRRASNIQEATQNHELVKATGKAFLMGVNVKEDWRDISNAFKQLTGEIKLSPEDKEFQAEFSFFRGTFLEPLLDKMGQTGKRINELDISIYKTSFGKKFLKLLGLKGHQFRESLRKNIFGEPVIETKLIGTPIAKLVGRAFLRIPVISVLFLFGLEIPAIYKSFCPSIDLRTNLKQVSKQIAKSIVNVSSITLSAGIVGAILARKGHIGSLIGIGVGSYVGSKAGNRINKTIDSV